MLREQRGHAEARQAAVYPLGAARARREDVGALRACRRAGRSGGRRP
jgi:hypothetical protein